MRFTQFRGGFHCSLQNFNYFYLRNFPSFRGYYMYLLTPLSIFDAVQNPKQIRQTEKIFECRKFFGNNNSSGTSAYKNNDGKVFLHFLIFPEKITLMIVLLGLLFCGKCRMEPNEMNKVFLKIQ